MAQSGDIASELLQLSVESYAKERDGADGAFAGNGKLQWFHPIIILSDGMKSFWCQSAMKMKLSFKTVSFRTEFLNGCENW